MTKMRGKLDNNPYAQKSMSHLGEAMLSGAKFGGAFINAVEEVEEENFESNDPNAVTLNSVANQTAKANDGLPKGEKVLTDLSKSKKEIVVAKFNDLDKLITLLQS